MSRSVRVGDPVVGTGYIMLLPDIHLKPVQIRGRVSHTGHGEYLWVDWENGGTGRYLKRKIRYDHGSLPALPLSQEDLDRMRTQMREQRPNPRGRLPFEKWSQRTRFERAGLGDRLLSHAVRQFLQDRGVTGEDLDREHRRIYQHLRRQVIPEHLGWTIPESAFPQLIQQAYEHRRAPGRMPG